MRKTIISAGLIAVLLLTGCSSDPPTPDGRIRIKNDSQDKDFNILSVTGGGAYFNLKPGESQLLPKGTSLITFVRRYPKITREYQVECPSKINGGIRIKLIDVHTGRIAGGCKTVSARTY